MLRRVMGIHDRPIDAARLAGTAVALALTFGSCASPPALERPPSFRDRHGTGDEIVACGKRFSIGAPVVLWFEPPGYCAYATEPRFSDDGPRGLRYRPGREVADPALRERVASERLELDALREVVDLFVLHYDVCGTSRTCFRVLQDERRLSVHFLLDVDGTIYQTLDLREQAWHARQANPRSIGIEIAHMGSYRPGEASPLDEWYVADEDGGVRLRLPERRGDGGIRTQGFQGRPARPARVRGEINGELWEMVDFTPEQYESLVHLTAALVEVFPRIVPDAPRDESGGVRADVLSDEDFAAFSGILGHYHVTATKRDPGPAFDWERFLGEVRAHSPSASRR